MDDKTIHIRLIGLSQKTGEKPTALHIAIEQGGTLLDLQGKLLWNGFVSVESFEETVNTFQASFSSLSSD